MPPIPPAPFPGGEWGDSRLFHARGFAPCIPGAEPRRHRSRGGVSCAGGGLAPALPDNLAVPEFAGAACLLCRRPALPLVFFFAPYPPNPLPRRGRGRPKDYFAGGFAPGTPALNRLRHLQTVPNRYPEAEPGRHRNRGRITHPTVGLPSLSPAAPAFSVLFCPLSSHPPSPAGKGEPKDYFAGGFAPGAPALDRLRHLQTVPNRYPETEPGRHHSQGAAFFRFCGKPWVQPRGCKGLRPLHKKTKILPLPAGKGVGGMGAKSKLKAG